MTDEDYWELEPGDLIVVDTEKGIEIVEFVEHLWDGGFFYKYPNVWTWHAASRDDLRCIIETK